jgi:hypothetical protein
MRCCDLIEQLHRLLPGILLCVAITGVAILLQAVEHFVGQAYLEARGRRIVAPKLRTDIFLLVRPCTIKLGTGWV